MSDQHPVIDADGHKCENPVVFLDYIDARFRGRFSCFRDRYGERRFRIVDGDPHTGRPDFARTFLQPEGYGKGTYRPYHEESTLGGIFNRVRVEHLEREGIDHQVIYPSVGLAFSSLIDAELAVELCRAYNDYIFEDCSEYRDRLHPVGVLPLQDPAAAVAEMRRCVLELGMPSVSIAPNLPLPHPAAPDRFPDVRVPKPLSHADFHPIYAEAERLGIGIGIHGAPGMQLAGGTSDQLDSFTLVHVFANRSMQQMAMAKLIFDGVLEAFPKLRFGFLEAGCGWLPDFVQSLREHWEKRIVQLDPGLDVSPPAFLREFASEESRRGRGLLRSVGRLASMVFPDSEGAAPAAELEAFQREHPKLNRDPLEYLERGQIFLTAEPGDPAVDYLPFAMGDLGRRVCGFATDYGHWDGTLKDCVGLVAHRPAVDADYASRLLCHNALDFYGERLRRCMA